MQLKYNRQPSFGSSLLRTLVKLLVVVIFFILAIFLIEKINFPSPEKKYNIDITNDIKKLYYSIGEVSEMVGLKSYVLRYWETEFKQLSPPKNRAGNRTYRQKDIDLIMKIKENFQFLRMLIIFHSHKIKVPRLFLIYNHLLITLQ